MQKIPIIIILGPTASGKTNLSVSLAKELNGEIISADSMQVYRKMNIGTGKASPKELKSIPHHLIDIVDPSESFSIARYISLADQASHSIFAKNKRIFLVGGTPLYLKRFIEGISKSPPANPKIRENLQKLARKHGHLFLYHRLCQVDPNGARRIDPQNQRRVIRALEVFQLTGIPISESWKHEGKTREPYSFHIFGLRWERSLLYKRIERRIDEMIKDGWVEEVKEIKKTGFSKEASKALGYREILEALEQNLSINSIVPLIKRNTRRFAKRQISWLSQFKDVSWIDLDEKTNPKKLVQHLKENFFSKTSF